MKRLRNYIILFLLFFSSLKSDAQCFSKKRENRLHFRNLKNEIWRFGPDLSKLKKNDTVYFTPRYSDRKKGRNSEGKYYYYRIRFGDIWFKRNGKILRRVFANKNVKRGGNMHKKFGHKWIEYGEWHKENGLLIIEVADSHSSLEWCKKTEDVIKLMVVDVIKK